MSICNGWDEIIDRHLSIQDIGRSPHYRHIKSAKRLSQFSAEKFDFQSLLNEMLTCLESNWQLSPRRDTHGPSDENWRFEKKLHIAVHNSSLEKTLEKALVNEEYEDAENRANQVPTASGLFGVASDKLRNIDLVQRQKPGVYHFIELKVESGTPLLAAIEVLQYAVLYTFARLHYGPRLLQAKELLQADTIHLRVLAPPEYYEPYNLEWLIPEINVGLQTFLAQRALHITMDFQFMAFPNDFKWVGTDRQCSAVFKAISPVVWH